MPRLSLVHCDLLDPRSAAQAAGEPIAGAVNIPLRELPGRTHELPSREVVIPVADPSPLAERTVSWLIGHGRRAVVQPDYHFAEPTRAPQVGRLWQPSGFLVEVLAELRPGAALDLACGTGREAVFLASRGWEVTGVDVLPDAIARGRDLAGRCAPAIQPIRWLEADLEREPPTFGAQFDLIVGFRYLHRPLLGRFADWLTDRGSVVYETFTTLHRARYGKPARQAHVLRPGELPGLLAGFEIRHFSEAWRGKSHTARVWAVKA